MSDYDYVVSDASTGTNIGELPSLSGVTFSRLLNGCGTFSGTLPMDSPLLANLSGDREITAFRDDVPAWSGPVSNLAGNLASRTVTVTAREASWYLFKRTLEVNSSTLWTNPADLFAIVRALVTYMTSKTDGGSINAALPRFAVSPSSATAGHTKSYTYFGSARHLISDIMQQLTDDPTAGIDWKMDYATGSTRQACQRTLTLGYPSLGATRTRILDQHLLADVTVQHDRERAANRVHALGSGYTSTQQNTGSIGAGDILIEEVFDASSLTDHGQIDDRAKDARRLAQPPVKVMDAAHVPGLALEFGWADLGDVVTVNTTLPGFMGVSATRRIVQIDVTPPNGDAPEVESYTFNLPLDQLGT